MTPARPGAFLSDLPPRETTRKPGVLSLRSSLQTNRQRASAAFHEPPLPPTAAHMKSVNGDGVE